MAENDPDVQKLYEEADRKATLKYGRPAGLGIGGVLLLMVAFSNLDPSFFLQSYIRSHGVSAHGHVIDTTTYRIYDELTVKFSNAAGRNYEKTYNITPAAQAEIRGVLERTKQSMPVEVVYLSQHPWLFVIKGIRCWNPWALIFLGAPIGVLPLFIYILCRDGVGPHYMRRADFPSNEPEG